MLEAKKKNQGPAPVAKKPPSGRRRGQAAGDRESHALETEMAAILLRKAAALSERSFLADDASKAQTDVGLLLDEIVDTVPPERARSLKAALEVAYSSSGLLAEAKGKDRAFLESARERLRQHFGQGGWSPSRAVDRRRANKRKAPPTHSKKDALRLVSVSLALATKRINTTLRSSGTGDELADQAEMRRVVSAALNPVSRALDGLSSFKLTAREKRQAATRIKALSAALGELQAWATASKEKPHAIYRRMFDLEDLLLAEVGLEQQHRYIERSGNAKKIVEQIAQTSKKGGGGEVFKHETKGDAIATIASLMPLVFAAQEAGVMQAQKVVDEPPDPPSGWEILADIAISLAITSAAAGVGFAAKRAMTRQLLKVAGLRRDAENLRTLAAVIPEAVKDSAKMLVKTGLQAAVASDGRQGAGLSIAALKGLSEARTPKNLFFFGQAHLVQTAKVDATAAFGPMRAELRKYDLDTLDLVAASLAEIARAPEVVRAQEQVSLREWMNFKARLNNPEALRRGSRREGALRPADAHNLSPPEGFLQVALSVNDQREIGISSIEIGGAEPAARQSLKASGLTVATAKMNAVVRVVDSRNVNQVVIHRSPDSKSLLLPELTLASLAWLKAFAARLSFPRGFPWSDPRELNAINARYDRADAMRAARALVAAAEPVPLSRL